MNVTRPVLPLCTFHPTFLIKTAPGASEIQESVFPPDAAEPVLSGVEGLPLGYVLPVRTDLE